MTYPRETLKQGGYKHIGCHHGEHLLLELDSNSYEIWFSNKYHARYALIYKNTELEFARGATTTDLRRHGINPIGKEIML